MCQDSPGDVVLIMKLLSNIIGRKVSCEKLYRSRNYIYSNTFLKNAYINQCQFPSIIFLFHQNVKGCLVDCLLFFILMYSICLPSSCTFAVPF